MGKRTKTVTNAIVFYLCWFVTAYGVAWDLPWVGPVLIAGYLVVHWLVIVPSNREMLFILAGGLLGFSADNLFLHTGVVDYGRTVPWFLAPFWMLFVWFSFLSLFHVSLAWLRTRYLLASSLGAVGGPLSYQWADSIGVFTLGEPLTLSLVVLGISWALITPTVLWLSKHHYFDVDPGPA